MFVSLPIRNALKRSNPNWLEKISAEEMSSRRFEKALLFRFVLMRSKGVKKWWQYKSEV